MESNATRCEQCRLYAELKEPFHYERLGYPQGVTVFGFCTKNIGRLQSFYPVYLPDGGVCEEFVRNPNKPKPPVEGQLKIEMEV